MILSDTQIRSALQTGRVELLYSFLPSTRGKGIMLRHAAGPYGQHEGVRSAFERMLTRNRLALSLGPLVKPLRSWRRVPPSIRFGDHGQLVDLRQCGNRGWALAPGEAAVAFSNEWLRLPSDLVGFVYGRVSTFNNGIVVAATYLDSTWEGLVKLHIFNSSGRSVTLHLGMEVARLFLAEADAGSADDHSVARQDIHYGFTWSRIIGDGIDPFPASALQQEHRHLTALRGTSQWLKEYAGYGLLGLLAAGAVGAVQLYVKLSEPLDLVPKVSQLQASVDQINKQQAISGVETVHIDAGATSGQAVVTLPHGVPVTAGTAYIAANAGGPAQGIPVGYQLRNNGGTTSLVLTVTLARSQTTDMDVNVQWLVVP